MLVEGHGQWLFDEKGRRYLDAFAGIVTVSCGHSHPAVTAAMCEQIATLMHTTTIYLNPQIALFAQELAARLPPGLSSIFFTNSGSEANDLAVLLARLHSGSAARGGEDVICLRNGYHGMSAGTMGLTALSTWKYPVAQPAGFHHAVCPDTYRGAFGPDTPRVGERYAEDVADIIRSATSGRIAGFISETVQGVGGSVAVPPGYLSAAYSHVRAAGGLCIADEVQTGFGRMGSHYWGFQTQGVVPDVVTMAKGIGNGAPLAAVATTPEIAALLAQKVYFNTYGGNPVSCAAGRAVLRIIDEEKLQANAAVVGAHLKSELDRLAAKHTVIGDVRGAGLMLGVELVKDRKSKAPATAEAAVVFEAAKDAGVLLGKGGIAGNVFRIKPPLCFTRDDADFLVAVLDDALSAL